MVIHLRRLAMGSRSKQRDNLWSVGSNPRGLLDQQG